MRGTSRIRRRLRAPVRTVAAYGAVALAFGITLAAAVESASGAATIVLHGSAKVTYPSDSTTGLTLTPPAGAVAGDILIATLGFGSSAATTQPTLTAPAGWTLVNKTNRDPVGSLAVYRHVYSSGETSYTWTTSRAVGATLFVAAFGGVDQTTPIDVAGGLVAAAGNNVTAPSVTTTAAGDVLFTAFYAHRNNATGDSWTPPSGMTEILDANNGGSRSGSIDWATQSSAGSTGTKVAVASAKQDYGIGMIVALKRGPDAPPPSLPQNGITLHGQSSATYTSDSTTSLRLTVPAGAVTGDVLIASLGFGSSSATSQPALTAPSGWTLVNRTNKDPQGSLAVYQHVLAAGETSFTWTTSRAVGGAIFLSAFAGVDATNPVDPAAAGNAVLSATSIATPSITTGVANETLLASYFGYRGSGVATTWTPPSGMLEVADANNGSSRSGTVAYGVQTTAGSTGPAAATASGTQDYAVASLIGLRPAGSTPPPPPSTSGIVLHGSTQTSYASDTTTSLRLAAPAGAVAGDVLVASLGYGSSNATTQPGLTAPSGWTLASQTNKDAVGSLAVYWHVFAAGETSYTWTTSRAVGGAIFLSAFGGVDSTAPIDVANGRLTSAASSIPTPSLTTLAANDALVASYFGYRGAAAGGSWTAPAGMTELGDTSNGGSRSGSVAWALQAAAGTTGNKSATASAAQDYAMGALTALRPAGSPPPPPAPAGDAAIVLHGSTQRAYTSDSTTTLQLTAPAGAESGDVLIASLGFGSSSAATQPTLTVPAGWTLVTKTNKDPVGSLAIYWHVFTAGETSWSWTTSRTVGGVVFVAAFGGVDTSAPIDAAEGQIALATSTPATPSLTTTKADLLLASYFGYKSGSSGVTWTPPAAMTEVADLHDNGSRSSALARQQQAAAGSTGAKTATANASQDYAIAALVALKPAPFTPLAVTIDTDMFTSPDDAEALAIAFALQKKNEAKVIAIGVSTRDTKAVVPASWKCVAAITQFYGQGSVPIGIDPPGNSTAVNSPDMVGPCSALASPSTPSPDAAVNVYRRALASQPDGSVVMVSTGYLENLSNLLTSTADAISPLSGLDLIARKVRRLVIMGGGYPSRSGETNLSGYATAAQRVADGWPTKIVWSGYEVGNSVHAGSTISSTHPSNSPVRVAYETLISPGNWYLTYDLTAVYHAIRPTDSNLVPTGPGKNTVDSAGGNVFTAGAGTQYYLLVGNATALGTTLDGLLGTLP